MAGLLGSGSVNESELADVVAWVLFAALALAVVAAVWYRFMRQQCPDCMSWVDNRATRCRHCGEELD
jgi:ribosomal protein L40E